MKLLRETPPTLHGEAGHAWKASREDMLEGVKNAPPGTAPIELTVAYWVVNAPWAHPVWPDYIVSAISLRHYDGTPDATIFLPGATHEVWVMALDPSHDHALDKPPHFLTPANFIGQWIAADDAAAEKKIDECVQDIVNGLLSPDTDFRSVWAKRFSDSNIKR